jgi:flagellar capping protein FliD
LNDFLTTQVAETGTLATQTANLTKQNKALDTQIAQLDLELASQRTMLEASFIAMENSSSMYASQAAQLTAAFK